MTSEVRDELVRVLMPELRVLTEHLVKTAVERSLASVLDRQRELEAKVTRSGGASFDKPRDFEAQIQAAIAPLFTKQRELEAMLAASRHSDVYPQSSPGRGALHVPEQQVAARRAGPPPLPSTQAAAQAPAPVAVARPAMGPRPDALAIAALSSNALDDIPAELNGSRRKRVVVFLLLIVLIGILATVASLSVMSNMGAYP